MKNTAQEKDEASPEQGLRRYIFHMRPDSLETAARITGQQPEEIMTGATSITGFWSDGPKIMRWMARYLKHPEEDMTEFSELYRGDQEKLVSLVTDNRQWAMESDIGDDYIKQMIEWIEEEDPAFVSRLTKLEWVSPPDEVREYIVEATPETALALAKETGCQPERIITGRTPVAGFWNDGPEVQRRTGDHLGLTGSALIPFLDLDHADQERLVGMMTDNGHGATPEELSADYISRMLARFEHEAPGFIRRITSNPAQE